MTGAIDIKPAEGKGIGVFATKFIFKGTIILKERPILTLRGAPIIETEFKKLSEFDQACVLELHEPNLPSKGRVARIVQGNCFGNGNHSYLYLKIPRINHSCVPNALVEAGEQATVRAIKDIAKGEEIEISYSSEIPEVLTARQRAPLFRVRYDFECRCPACTNNGLSDTRRQLIRVLKYALQGLQPPDCKPFEDPNIKTFKWPPPTSPLHRHITNTQRISFNFRLAHLREAEGLNPLTISYNLATAAGLLANHQEGNVQTPATKDIIFLEAVRCMRAWYQEALKLRKEISGSSDEIVRLLRKNWDNVGDGTIMAFLSMMDEEAAAANRAEFFAVQADLAKFQVPPRFLSREQVEELLGKRKGGTEDFGTTYLA